MVDLIIIFTLLHAIYDQFFDYSQSNTHMMKNNEHEPRKIDYDHWPKSLHRMITNAQF